MFFNLRAESLGEIVPKSFCESIKKVIFNLGDFIGLRICPKHKQTSPQLTTENRHKTFRTRVFPHKLIFLLLREKKFSIFSNSTEGVIECRFYSPRESILVARFLIRNRVCLCCASIKAFQQIKITS